MVFGSIFAGQALSRTGGHYRIQGAIGIGVMAFGMFLLSNMTVETSNIAVVRNIIILGLGLGATMPIYTIAVQNAVPHSVLGAATSSTAFFRSIGGSIGLAIFGSVLNNRFSAELLGNLPAAVKAVIPAERLTELAHNPQALVNPQAQSQLQNMFSQLGSQGAALFEEVLSVLRHALSSSLTEVFLIGFFILIAAFITNLFIKEIPLQRKQIPAGKRKPGL